MRVDELFRQSEFSRDEILLRMKNAKSKEEKEKWAVYLVKHRLTLSEETMREYLKRLVSKEGIEKIGAGAFSQVFQHPQYGNVAVKVYTAKDTTYKRYVDWCLKHQSNPYVPRMISQVPIRTKSGEKYFVLFLEKMQEIYTKQKLVSLLSSILNLSKTEEAALRRSEEFDTASDFRVIDAAVRSGRGDRDFREIWRHLRTYGEKKFDLHSGNVMLRDGHLVITDPVAVNPTSRFD